MASCFEFRKGTVLADASSMHATKHSANYSDLVAWQKAMGLVEAVYSMTCSMPAEERFGLTSQMRRASVSIPANIAEGEGRRTDGEFLNHLSAAHGSIRELETHVMLAERLRFMRPEEAGRLLTVAAEVGRLVTGLANSIERRCARRKAQAAKASTVMRSRN